jgi:hypothetical protein
VASISVRFQAGVFAAALLIHDDTARGLGSLEELSVQAGIDTLSARVYYEEVQSTILRARPSFSAVSAVSDFS